MQMVMVRRRVMVQQGQLTGRRRTAAIGGTPIECCRPRRCCSERGDQLVVGGGQWCELVVGGFFVDDRYVLWSSFRFDGAAGGGSGGRRRRVIRKGFRRDENVVGRRWRALRRCGADGGRQSAKSVVNVNVYIGQVSVLRN